MGFKGEILEKIGPLGRNRPQFWGGGRETRRRGEADNKYEEFLRSENILQQARTDLMPTKI